MRGYFDAFFRITARWRLTHAEQRALLGAPTEERWSALVHESALRVTPEELARVNAIIQIDEALLACISDPHQSVRWLRTLEMAPPFFGRTPLALLFRGLQGFKAIVEYLEARRPAAHAPIRR